MNSKQKKTIKEHAVKKCIKLDDVKSEMYTCKEFELGTLGNNIAINFRDVSCIENDEISIGNIGFIVSKKATYDIATCLLAILKNIDKEQSN